jgi:branched-chain amino acid transport system permease protein
VLGGLGTLPGALWGSLVLVLVPTYLTNVGTSHGLSSAASSSVPIAAYGVILIVVMLVFPAGIQGGIRRLFGSAAAAPLHRDADVSDSTAPRRRIPFTALRHPAPGGENQEEGPS